VIATPTAWQRLRWWLEDTGGTWALLPIGVLAAMSLAWRRFGRDPKLGEAIAVQYEPPPGFTPAEVGTIYDESADLDDVTSTILDLAIRGWIRIEEIEAVKLLFFSMKDYRLVRLPDPAGQTLKPHEEKMLAGLFEFGVKEVLVSDLREKFYTHLPGVQEAIYEELSGTVFAANPRRVRQVWMLIAIVVVIAGFFAAAPYGPVAAVAICASAGSCGSWGAACRGARVTAAKRTSGSPASASSSARRGRSARAARRPDGGDLREDPAVRRRARRGRSLGARVRRASTRRRRRGTSARTTAARHERPRAQRRSLDGHDGPHADVASDELRLGQQRLQQRRLERGGFGGGGGGSW
jgi:hypothetical protein